MSLSIVVMIYGTITDELGLGALNLSCRFL